MISRTGRARFAAGDLLSGTTEEKARAGEGFVAYAGRYSFHGDHVVHHVELSLFPNWVGTDQQRTVELAGDRLTLSASPLLLAGKQQVPRLISERVERPRVATDTALAAAGGDSGNAAGSATGQDGGPAPTALPGPTDATCGSDLASTAAAASHHSARTVWDVAAHHRGSTPPSVASGLAISRSVGLPSHPAVEQ